MSFNGNKNETSVFLQNFQKRLSKFFQNSTSFTPNLPENSAASFEISDTQKFNLKNNIPISSSGGQRVSNSQNLNLNNTNTSKNARRKNEPATFIASFAKSADRFSRSEVREKRGSENTKQQVVSITYEEIGLFPRSFNRVFDRFFKQLFFDVENLVIQEYRFYRYLFLTTVQCIFVLLFVPLSINFLAKNYLVRPITEHYWNSHQPEIFLNSYQQKRAFNELQDFEEKIYFESLILPNPTQNKFPHISSAILQTPEVQQHNQMPLVSTTFDSNANLTLQHAYAPEFFSDSVQNRLHEKILELAIHYNEESIEAITNFFADFISFSSLCYLFFALEIQINITKSFLLEVFFGLDDSKKSLFILFLTDLLVGYHSPNIWELFFSSFFDHYGLPENQTTIFLLVATLPVLLDVLFKYLIFRHLNRASPATVATYHAMIE